MNPIPMNIPLDKTTGVLCSECENNTFSQSFLLRKASKFLTGEKQDAIMPIVVFACLKCQHVNDDFIPAELRHQYAEVIPDEPV